MSDQFFVPVDFAVPEGVTAEEFRLEPLGPRHNAADYGELQVRPRDWARALLLCQYEHPAIVCWRGRRRAPSRDRTPDP
jgi:hypothetical protein